MSDGKTDWAIIENGLEDAETRLSSAIFGVNQAHASIRQPAASVGDLSNSYNAAAIVAEAKRTGVEAEVAALKVAFAKKPKH